MGSNLRRVSARVKRIEAHVAVSAKREGVALIP
jgi:hypothetical protein